MEIKNAVEITWVTLLGVPTNKYPVSSGNCFSVVTEDEKEYRIVNFAYENMKEALRKKISYPVKIGVLGEKTAIIHDERIPDNWYENRFCEVCCPDNLLPMGQQLKHQRQEARGERTVKDNGIFTNPKKGVIWKDV